MATCVSCGKELGFSDRMNAKSYAGLCIACSNVELEVRKATQDPQEILQQKQAISEKDAAISAIILTTETAPNLKIVERLEIVTAEVAYGMNIFKDLFAGVRDFVGGRSAAVQNTLRDARRTALYELKREALEVGANAVVGVDLDYVNLSAAGSMVMLVASGTAVRIED